LELLSIIDFGAVQIFQIKDVQPVKSIQIFYNRKNLKSETLLVPRILDKKYSTYQYYSKKD
jgi:hypothetical protein